jgi:hypothetical protein
MTVFWVCVVNDAPEAIRKRNLAAKLLGLRGRFSLSHVDIFVEPSDAPTRVGLGIWGALASREPLFFARRGRL